MLNNGLDYKQTVETKKLEFKGKKSELFTCYFVILLGFSLVLLFSYMLNNSQLSNNPSITDYIISYFLPIVLLLSMGVYSKTILNRDKLLEIENDLHINDASRMLLEAAGRLNWSTETITDNHIIFLTKQESVTIIFFPGNKIFFNSLYIPNNFTKPARFDENYQLLNAEYIKVRNELKTAGNTV